MKEPNILLIDDEVAFVLNIAEMLTMIGYKASMAFNGRQGLLELKRNCHDVVVLDLKMPGLSGIDVLKKIRLGLNTSPEVIILTGFGSAESYMESFQGGAFDYLTKPIKISDLVNKIKEAYHRKLLREAH